MNQRVHIDEILSPTPDSKFNSHHGNTWVILHASIWTMRTMNKKDKSEFINREISWLSFNERVLQEATDKTVPLIERIRFLGIFANNLDEFFKVRVATLHRATGLFKKPIDPMDFDPVETLSEINQIVVRQQTVFDQVFSKISTELVKENIQILNEKTIRKEHLPFVKDYFTKELKPHLVPVILNNKTPFPQLSDNRLYFVIELVNKERQSTNTFALIELPDKLKRFVVLPSGQSDKAHVMFADDIIRLHLKELFNVYSFDHANAYALKTIRDAELDIDDDLSKSFVEKVSRSINQRKRGQYVRITYDRSMPQVLLDFILKKIKIRSIESISAGGRYHNKKDLMQFPDFGKKNLVFAAMKTIDHHALQGKKSMLNEIRKKDILLHFPYHSFNLIIDLLREASIDPDVRTIRISLYRVARNSQIISTLINAARNGKRVIAVVELQARFDEENNISVSRILQEAGIRVIPGVPGLKVHCKLIQISRKEGARTVRYVHIGTGNFHESTASVYTDISLLTARKEIGSEVRRIFEFFENNFQRSAHRHLIVSPFGTRRKFTDLINHEIALASKGKRAWIILKMNNLVDPGLIRKLYEASQAGVKIQLIIRGICSLVPGIAGRSENISVVSIVGRFLEHSRILVFGNGGKPQYYISSADWMVRNIDHRIEVSCPVYDEQIKQNLQEFLNIQLGSEAKARRVDKTLKNEYLIPAKGKSVIDTQMATHKYLAGIKS